jgi:hypothetical protein
MALVVPPPSAAHWRFSTKPEFIQAASTLVGAVLGNETTQIMPADL